jgi:hypothetical protein
MNKIIRRITGLVMAIVMILGNTVQVKAIGNTYYVSPTGNDANPGTATAPFRTFAKANSLLTAGSTLYIYAGVYNQQLKITKSGTSSAVITVRPVGGTVAIDLQRLTSPAAEVRASYVTVIGLEVRNSSDVCVNLAGTNINVIGLVVHDCGNHGIQANNSSVIRILDSRIYRAVLSNSARLLTSGWGSGIKIRESNTVLIQGNTVYNNYGEGMGTRGTNITIRGNLVYNNYSVNIYTNSENALIDRNFVYCTSNTGFERSGLPAVGIGMGEEYYAGWGARLKMARVLNNIVAFCRNGIRYMGADAGVTGGGLKGAVLAYNTLYGSTNAALSIVYASAQSGNLIANNIIWQAQNNLTAIDSPVGITFQNNLWKVAPPAAYRSPGDRYGDPRFTTPPAYSAESYRPSSTSPAARAAVNISVIQTDYFGRPRGPFYDIGAIQFSSSTATSSTQALNSPTATSQPTNTVLPATPQSTLSPAPTLVQPTSTLPSATPLNTASPVPASTQTTSTAVPVTPTLMEPALSPTALPPTLTSTSVPVQPSSTATAQPAQGSQETNYDNKHSAFVYSAGWVEEVSAYAIDGSFARTSTNGASVTFQFTGQSFSLIYKGGPSYRKMDVYIDGVLAATIDERLDVSTYKARWDYPGQLPPGAHTLKLVFVTTSASTNGSVDAVLVR